MPIVAWSEEYKVNVAEIDEQHQQMLELVNKLHAAVEARIDKTELMDMLSDLVEFSRMHFSMEEGLMREHGYPGLTEHHKEHRQLLGYLIDLVEGVSVGRSLGFYSDYDVSTDWALTHICETDKSLGLFLNSKGIY